MADEKDLLSWAEEAEKKAELGNTRDEFTKEDHGSVAHSIYAQLAYKFRSLGDAVKAKFYNNRAGTYAPDNKEDWAAGYIAIEDDDDDE